jgi:hypothetical protein
MFLLDLWRQQESWRLRLCRERRSRGLHGSRRDIVMLAIGKGEEFCAQVRQPLSSSGHKQPKKLHTAADRLGSDGLITAGWKLLSAGECPSFKKASWRPAGFRRGINRPAAARDA